MPVKNIHRFYLSVVFPSIVAIILFILSIFIVILPTFEKNIMDKKKEMISELTNTAWSLLEEYNQEYQNLNYPKEEAQKMAAAKIEQIRYGGENKDYFWIIDEHPNMIMHPYRYELIDADLTNYQDPNGKKLFVEATKLVAQNGEGFIDYMWQWKDDSTRIVPKLSFVRAYKPWGWIIGTGIYLEDVKQEISTLKNRFLRISLFITLIIAIILSYVIRQSLKIENERKDAQAKLLLSKLKYKSLVAASTEGTLMILNQNIIFSNIKFSKLSGHNTLEVLSLKFEDIFRADWNQLISSFDDPKRSISLETQIKCQNGTEKEVVLSVSKINYASDQGYIIITKELTRQKHLEKETVHLCQELQTSLLLMNQPIRPYIDELVKCSVDTSIQDAVELMIRKRRDVLFVQKDNEIIGVINNSDLKKRVLAKNMDTQKSVMEIMTSPVFSIPENALLYEAVLLLKKKKITHLATKNELDAIVGVISYEDVTGMQQNTVSFLIKEIEFAEDVDYLHKIQNRLAALVNALIESGDKPQNITRIITSVSDAITHRIIWLAIGNIGKPPCEFAFMVMGSEGRMEQTLSTDQDNAIVFENQNSDDLEAVKSYFLKLGQEVCQKLSEVGFKLCDGEIMALNPKWTQPLSKWKDYFSEWINVSDPQSILDASIFFDFRCVYGNHDLINDLRLHVNKAIDNKSVFFYHLAQSVIKYRPPLSLFGKIIGNNRTGDHAFLDVKKVLFPIIGFVRLYALQTKLHDTNTLERINQLYLKKIINQTMHDDLVLAYNYLMHLRFRSQSKSILRNKIPDNKIDIDKLSHIEITTIKKIFIEIGTFQTKLTFDFKGTM